MVYYIVVGAVYLLGIPVSAGTMTGGYGRPERGQIFVSVVWPAAVALILIVAVGRGLWRVAKAAVQALYWLGAEIGKRLP